MTPSKYMLGMRVVKTDNGVAATWAYTMLREWLVKDAIGSLTLGIGYICLLWDTIHQNLHDELLSTVVVGDPLGMTLAANRRPKRSRWWRTVRPPYAISTWPGLRRAVSRLRLRAWRWRRRVALANWHKSCT